MTLIVTAATKDFIFQVADTRLTRIDGTFFDDKLVKTTLVNCHDANISISYTGLAFISGTRTDIWLALCLKEFKAWQKTFTEVVEFLKSELTKAASIDGNLEKYGLTLVLAGLGVNKYGFKDIAIALITNNERPVPNRYLIEHIKPQKDFSRHYFEFNPRDGNLNRDYLEDGGYYYISVHGAVEMNQEINALRRQIADRLLEANTNEKLDEIMNFLVSWVGLQRKSKQVGHLIGDDCTVVHIDRKYKGTLFFFSNDKKEKRFPNIVSKDNVIIDFVKEIELKKEQ